LAASAVAENDCKTGGLFIKALPKQANLYINGDFIKKLISFLVQP